MNILFVRNHHFPYGLHSFLITRLWCLQFILCCILMVISYKHPASNFSFPIFSAFHYFFIRVSVQVSSFQISIKIYNEFNNWHYECDLWPQLFFLCFVHSWVNSNSLHVWCTLFCLRVQRKYILCKKYLLIHAIACLWTIIFNNWNGWLIIFLHSRK